MTMVRRKTWIWLCLLWWVHAGYAQAQPQDTQPWDQWRGPSRNGAIAGPAWPESLQGDHLAVKWRVGLGPGYSGAVVVADRVFVTETVDDKVEAARAVDRATGKEIWKTSWKKKGANVSLPARRHGNWVKSTPAFDGERLYAAGMEEVLVCLSGADGAVLWSIDFPKEYGTPVPGFGCVSSPLVVGDHVYMQAASSFVKVDKRTGQVLWRVLVADKFRVLTDDGAESSPVFAVIQKQPQLVVQARPSLHGVDPESGKVLWSQPTDALMDNNILTPIVLGDHIFTSSQHGGVSLYYIRRHEFGLTPQTRWHQSKPSGYMSSPVVVGDHGYLHLGNNRLACIELRAGTAVYTTKPFGDYWSMVVQGDKVLALDASGELMLFRANPAKFDLIDRRKISEQDTWGHVAVFGEQIFVREKHGLLALEWR
jgi:outer membrane protein assembly factor BamB